LVEVDAAMMRGGAGIVNEMEFSMCNGSESLSPKSICCGDEFNSRLHQARSPTRLRIHALDRSRAQRQRIIFRSDGIDDTTIARSPLYSVSHFIDCGRAARRLGPSRSASTQNAFSKPR
jgi:hypothetical protein